MDYPKYVKINDSDIIYAIKEGINPMTQWYDPKHGNIPYFWNAVGSRNANTLDVSASIGHTEGRWLEALSIASRVSGVPIPPDVVSNLRYWTLKSFDNPQRMPNSLTKESLSTDTLVQGDRFDLHNLREVMHSFTGLLRFNPDDNEVKELVLHLINVVNTYTDFETGDWLFDKYRKETGGELYCAVCPNEKPYSLVGSVGRYTSALMHLYREWPIQEALEQCGKIVDCLMRNVFLEDGDFDPDRFVGHVHSTTSTLQGLALYGSVTGDMRVLNRVRKFIENGLNKIAIPELGWSTENYYRRDLVGEVNNSSDVLEACLCLGKAGYDEYYEMAERIIRRHILPSQLLDVSFLPDDVSEDDSVSRFASRMKGAFGFPCPYGHEFRKDYSYGLSPYPEEILFDMSFNWDIVAGAVSGLSQAWTYKTTEKEGCISLNLLFDQEDDRLSFESPYGRGGECSLTLKKRSAVRIRLGETVRFMGAELPEGAKASCIGNWLYLFDLPLYTPVKIKLDLKVYEQEFEFKGYKTNFRFEGDRVLAAESKDKRLCYFPEM